MKVMQKLVNRKDGTGNFHYSKELWTGRKESLKVTENKKKSSFAPFIFHIESEGGVYNEQRRIAIINQGFIRGKSYVKGTG